jgi:hypothetical protein
MGARPRDHPPGRSPRRPLRAGRQGRGHERLGDSGRAGVFDRPDAAQITARLGTALTDAITRVLGEELRTGTMVELVASPQERTFVGGALAV